MENSSLRLLFSGELLETLKVSVEGMLKKQGYIQGRLAFLNTQIIESLQGVEFLDRLVEQTPIE